jgi:hypothetical protein
MTRWKIFSPDQNRHEYVNADGLSLDSQGNIVFVNATKTPQTINRTPGPDTHEIVAVLAMHSGVLSRKED